MKIAFDLHNIRDGGGPNYIRNLLAHADPALDGFESLHLFGSSEVLGQFPGRPFVIKHTRSELSRGLVARLAFVYRRMPALLRQLEIDVLYVPGGLAFGNFRPYATISRNMMPFTPEAWGLYPAFSRDRARLSLLRRLNSSTFARSDAMIFLTETARANILPYLTSIPKIMEIVSHGVDHERFAPPVERAPIDQQRDDVPIRLVYPSRLEPYKHQVEMVQALARHLTDLPQLRLDLFGPANPGYLADFERVLHDEPAAAAKVFYHGELPNAELPAIYACSDILIFASSCENLPNILIEAMASGIPICCSDRSPMPEVAGDAAFYFDPVDPASIAAAIRQAITDPGARADRIAKGLARAEHFNWADCARKTFQVLVQTAGRHCKLETN